MCCSLATHAHRALHFECRGAPVVRRGDAARVAPPCPTTSCVWRSLPYLTFRLPVRRGLARDKAVANGQQRTRLMAPRWQWPRLRERSRRCEAEGGTQPVGRVVSEGASLGGSGVGSASFWKFFFELASLR